MNGIIAIPYQNGNIFDHFGKTKTFKIYTINEDIIEKSEISNFDCSDHESVGLWLVMQGVNAVICDNIGPGSLGALTAAGIVVLAGVEGDANEAMKKFIAGELTPTSKPNCNGHNGGCSSDCGSARCSCSSHCASHRCNCS